MAGGQARPALAMHARVHAQVPAVSGYRWPLVVLAHLSNGSQDESCVTPGCTCFSMICRQWPNQPGSGGLGPLRAALNGWMFPVPFDSPPSGIALPWTRLLNHWTVQGQAHSSVADRLPCSRPESGPHDHRQGQRSKDGRQQGNPGCCPTAPRIPWSAIRSARATAAASMVAGLGACALIGCAQALGESESDTNQRDCLLERVRWRLPRFWVRSSAHLQLHKVDGQFQ